MVFLFFTKRYVFPSDLSAMDSFKKTMAPESDFEREPSRKDRYQHLLIDDAFKRVFGEEGREELMIGLIKAVLPELDIVSLTYISNNAPHHGTDTKKSVYDVRCKLGDGTSVIVEVQQKDQLNFRDRALYYGSMPISSQIGEGDEYYLDPVIVIAFLNFKMEHGPGWVPKLKSHYMFRDADGKDTMTDKLQFVFIELQRFTKKVEECETFEEKLYFCMRHMFKLESRPENLRGEYFDNLFQVADIANMTAKDHETYVRAMASERDIRNQIRYGRIQGHREGLEEGLQQGKAEEKIETAKKLKAAGIALETIAECTELELEIVKSL